MADFVQVMKDWRRMCKTVGGESCDGCELHISGNDCIAVYEGEMDYAQAEKAITAWAKKHPEPVYPTIAKYLEQFGITIRRDGSLQADFFKANEPMSADTAKLLGIGSEEGENEKTD